MSAELLKGKEIGKKVQAVLQAKLAQIHSQGVKLACFML